MQKIIVSRCLLGEPCRYDGKKVSRETLEKIEKELNALSQAVDEEGGYELIPVCPEVLGGLATPRPPGEIVRVDGDDKVINNMGEDVTNQYESGARQTLEIALKENVKIAILKAKSPSCGNEEIYDGTFTRKLIKGQGITVRLLRKNGIEVFSELEDVAINIKAKEKSEHERT